MSDQLSPEDRILVAQLGASVNAYNAKAAQNVQSRRDVETLNYRRLDFRNEVGAFSPSNNYMPSRPMPRPPQYHQQYADGNWQQGVPQNIPGLQDPDNPEIPTGNLNAPIPIIQMPPNLMAVAQAQGLAIPGNNPPGMTQENYENFNIPNYNQPPRPEGAVFYQRLEDEEEFREALIKEIKSQKKAINKLIRDQEKLILTIEKLLAVVDPIKIDPPQEQQDQKIDEVQDKS